MVLEGFAKPLEVKEHPDLLIAPAVVIGSSMVRNIMVPREKTLCYPGARVKDITMLLLTILRQLPGTDAVVVHVGSNDIRRNSSEILKIDFKELILALND